MSVKRIAGRYAKSLLDLSVEQGKTDAVRDDLTHFVEAVKNRDLYLLVKSPIVSPDKKSSIFREIFGKSYGELTNAFFDIILRKGRESYLPEIATEFLEMYNAHKGITSVTIKTATALSEAALADIKTKLLDSDLTAKDLDVETIVDPEIIGGFVLQIGDNLYDASIAHKLDALRKTFKDNTYVATN
jgi:F-type H+-transporting ATPase subunit delta